HRGGLEAPADAGLAVARLEERPLDRRAGLVLDVENARDRVPALARPVETGALAVERHAQLLDEEPLHEVGSLDGEKGDRLAGAPRGAPGDGRPGPGRGCPRAPTRGRRPRRASRGCRW